MPDNFIFLPAMVPFLKERMDEFVEVTYQLLPQYNIPVMQSLQHMSQEELKKMSRDNNEVFFQKIAEGNIIESSLADLDLLFHSQNPYIRPAQINVADFVWGYRLREAVFRHFLPSYTQDIETALGVMHELSELYGTLEEKAFETFIQLKNKEVSHKNEILENAQIQAKLGYFYYEIDKDEVYWSDFLFTLFGIEKQLPLKGMDVFDFITNIPPEEAREIFRHRLKRKDKNYSCRYQIRTGRGKSKTIIARCVVNYDNQQQAKSIRGIIQDITGQVELDADLRNTRDLLLEAQKIAHIGSWEYNLVTKKINFTPEHYRLFGFKEGESLTTEKFFRCIHVEDLPEKQKRYQQAITKGKGYEMDYRIVLPNGEQRWIKSHTKIWTNPETKELEKVYGTSQDITLLMRKEQELQELNKHLEKKVAERTSQLAESNKNLQNFAHVVAHDLKTPLRGIDGLSQFLFEDYFDSLGEQGKQYISMIRERVQFMENLIHGIFEYSQADLFTDGPSPVNMNELVQEIITTVDPAKKVDFHVGELPVLVMPITPLKQIFLNLLSNAVKFANEDDPRVSIEVEKKADRYQFEVSDNGDGINKKYQKQLFQLFSTLRHKKSGTGIGLSIVKKLVDKFEGQVELQSEAGNGAKFIITLPVAEQDPV